MTPESLLAVAAADFARWRAKKNYLTEPVPEALQQQVLPLVEHFSMNKIARALQLTEGLLARWQHEAAAEKLQHEQFFIELPSERSAPLSPDLPDAPTAATLALELELGNQCLIRLNGQLSPQYIGQLAREILMARTETA